MNTSKTKNLIFIILIAVVSSMATVLGYNAINRNKQPFGYSSTENTTSGEGAAYASTFNQDKNVVLTNLTTAEGYPDFTETAARR